MHHGTRDFELKRFGWLLHAAGLLTAVAVCAGTHFFACNPLATKAQEYVTRLAQYDTLLTKAATIREEHRHLTDTFAQLETRVAAVHKQVPDEPREASFLEDLNTIAQEQSVSIQDYQRGAAKTEETYSQLMVLLAVEGTYAGLCGFLDGLAHLPRTVTVEDLTIELPDARQRLPARLTLGLYYGLHGKPSDKGAVP